MNTPAHDEIRELTAEELKSVTGGKGGDYTFPGFGLHLYWDGGTQVHVYTDGTGPVNIGV